MIFGRSRSTFEGLEFAVFRLRDGVTEGDLLAALKRVEDEFLSDCDGVYGHFLLKGKTQGLYADVTLARTQELAEAVCQQWLTNPAALQYLELLDHDSVDMTFWSRIG